MEWTAVRDGHLIRFHRGEDIVGGLLDFARAHGIEGAWVNALGAIEDPELGYYHLDRREYTRQVFPGEWEITAIVGNLGPARRRTPCCTSTRRSAPSTSRPAAGTSSRGRRGRRARCSCARWARGSSARLDPDVGLNLWALGG